MSQITEIPRFPRCIRRIILSYGLHVDTNWLGFSTLASLPFQPSCCLVFGKELLFFEESFQDFVIDVLVAQHYNEKKEHITYMKVVTKWKDKPGQAVPRGNLEVFAEMFSPYNTISHGREPHRNESSRLTELIQKSIMSLWSDVDNGDNLISIKEYEPCKHDVFEGSHQWTFRPVESFDMPGYDNNKYIRNATLTIKPHPRISQNVLHEFLRSVKSSYEETIPSEVLAHMCPRQFNALRDLGVPILDMELTRTRRGWYALRWLYFERDIPIEMTNEGNRVFFPMWDCAYPHEGIPKKGGRRVKMPEYFCTTHTLAFHHFNWPEFYSRTVNGPENEKNHDVQETASMDIVPFTTRARMTWTNEIVWFARQWWYGIKDARNNHYWTPQKSIISFTERFNVHHTCCNMKVRRSLTPIKMRDLFN